MKKLSSFDIFLRLIYAVFLCLEARESIIEVFGAYISRRRQQEATMLVKKTIVLYGKGGQGHLTAVRVGGSTGLKLVLEAPIGKMALAFKAGNSGQLNFAITAAKTEIPLEINLESQDELSAVVYSEDGSEMLSGGKKTKFVFPKEIFDPTPQESKYTAKESDNAERTATVAENAAENATDNATDNATENTGENAGESNAEKVAETFADDVQAEQADTNSSAEIEAEQAGADIDEAAADEVSAAEEKREAEPDDSATVDEEKKNEEAATETVVKETQKVDNDKDDTIDLRAAFSGFAFNKGENFYINIRGKLEEIMTINPECKELERLIPDSKWVKVYYDEDEYYVVGILTEEGAVKYLGYGVPGVEGIRPPKEAEELCDFLASDGEEEGYWIMLQKADNGELVK